MQKLSAFFTTFAFWITLGAGPTLNAATIQYLDQRGNAVSQLLYGEPAAITMSGLSDHPVTLRCGRGSQTSMATFQPTPSGQVNLAEQAPIQGTYTGVDADGMWWSRTENNGPAIGSINDPFTCIAEQEGTESAKASLSRFPALPNIQSIDLTMAATVLVGRFSLPPGQGTFPALIVLGGSEGGHDPFIADYFASKGYATLSLAYFAEEGLPTALDRIPLEYFEHAIRWLQSQPQVRLGSLGIFGTSRGGELALLLASKFPVFQAVAPVVGSGLVWAGGYDESTGKQTSSWTHHGIEISFMAFPPMGPPDMTLPNGQHVQDVSALFKEALKNQDAIAAAMIPVEKIAAPILFLGGDDDRIWPSCDFGQRLFTQLKSDSSRRFADKLICYPNAGHAIGMPGFPTTDLTFQHPQLGGEPMFFGGTAAGTAHAQRQGWTELLQFFADHLGGQP